MEICGLGTTLLERLFNIYLECLFPRTIVEGDVVTVVVQYLRPKLK